MVNVDHLSICSSVSFCLKYIFFLDSWVSYGKMMADLSITFLFVKKKMYEQVFAILLYFNFHKFFLSIIEKSVKTYILFY